MPKCPANPEHGALYYWNRPPSFFPWYCPHRSHGDGNGLFVTQEMLEGGPVSDVYDEVVTQVLLGALTEPQALTIVHRRGRLDQDIRLVKCELDRKLRAARRLQAITAARKVEVPKVTPNAVQSIPAAEFMAALKTSGLTQKQAAVKIGRSASRVHELVSRGGTGAQYNWFAASLQRADG